MNERKYLKNVLQRLCDDNPKMQQFSKLKILPHIFQLWEIFIELVEKKMKENQPNKSVKLIHHRSVFR